MLCFAHREQFGPDWVSAFRAALSIDAIRAAEPVVRSAGIPRTPLMRHPMLCGVAGCEVYLKHENHLPTGAFKVRGGVNFMKHFAEESDAKGVITATRGNHGQSIGLAAQRYGIPCVVCVPVGNNPEKNAAMRAFGVELIEHGADYDAARAHAERLTAERGLHYVQGANEPHLINGVGTYWLEVAEDLPEFDVAIVPIGGGTGACGAITALRALKPDAEIIGVQAENAPAVYRSLKEGRLVTTDSANTMADGLATRAAFELPFAIMSDELDDIVLVAEPAIEDAIRVALRTTHNLIEGAAATSIAAILSNRKRFEGRTVVAAITGANLDSPTLKRLLVQA